MAKTNIPNINELNNLVLDLKSKVTSSLTNNINTLNSTLSNISNYSNNGFHANVGDSASKLKINFNNILTDMTNAEENIFNYISYINKFNVDDYDTSASIVDLESQYNSLYLGVPIDLNTSDDTENELDGSNKNKKTSDINHSSTSIDDSDNNPSKPMNSLETYLDKIEGKTISVNPNMQTSCIVINDSNDKNILDPKTLSIVNNISYDTDGLALFNDRYVISTTPNFGNVGDLIDIRQTDGTILKCIIANIEKTNDSTINFLANQSISISALHPNWLQSITSINNKGNYFDYINQLN